MRPNARARPGREDRSALGLNSINIYFVHFYILQVGEEARRKGSTAFFCMFFLTFLKKQNIFSQVVEEARRKGSTDDITVVLAKL